jgi:hypothetical protein
MNLTLDNCRWAGWKEHLYFPAREWYREVPKEHSYSTNLFLDNCRWVG